MIIDRRKTRAVQMNGFRGFNLDAITAGSQPVYDQNKIMPGNQDGWGVFEWIKWHQKLKARYGLYEANIRFLQAWENQSTWHWPYNWFKYDSEFKEYMKANKIDVGNMLSLATEIGKNTANAAGGLVNDAVTIVGDAGSGIKNTIGSLKYLLPLTVTAIVVGAGFYIYKNYIDGDKQFVVYGQKI